MKPLERYASLGSTKLTCGSAFRSCSAPRVLLRWMRLRCSFFLALDAELEVHEEKGLRNQEQTRRPNPVPDFRDDDEVLWWVIVVAARGRSGSVMVSLPAWEVWLFVVLAVRGVFMEACLKLDCSGEEGMGVAGAVRVLVVAVLTRWCLL